MAWTAPRTWVTAELETASIFNTHIRDNLKFLNTGRLLKATTKTVGTTITETDLLNGEITLPALVSTSVVRARLTCDLKCTSAAGATARVRLKLGGTTVLDTGAQVAFQSTNLMATIIEILIVNDGTTNSQFASVASTPMASSTITTGLAGGLEVAGGRLVLCADEFSTVQTNVAVALALTWQWGTSSAGDVINMRHAFIETFGVAYD